MWGLRNISKDKNISILMISRSLSSENFRIRVRTSTTTKSKYKLLVYCRFMESEVRRFEQNISYERSAFVFRLSVVHQTSYRFSTLDIVFRLSVVHQAFYRFVYV